jgi:nitronate monooxygenase
MAGVSEGLLAGAVSKAGGLGMIGVGPARASAYVEEQALVAASAGRPFGIGLLAWALEADPVPLEAVLESDAALVSVSFGNFEEPLQRLKAAGKLVTTQVGNLEEARRAEAAGVDCIVWRSCAAG